MLTLSLPSIPCLRLATCTGSNLGSTRGVSGMDCSLRTRLQCYAGWGMSMGTPPGQQRRVFMCLLVITRQLGTGSQRNGRGSLGS